jgi:hypothetical protein
MAFHRPELAGGQRVEASVLTMKKPKTANDWIMEMLGAGGVDPVPEGWVTLNELACKTRVHDRTMRSRVDTLVANGKLQKRQFRIRSGRDVRPVWHYSPVQ